MGVIEDRVQWGKEEGVRDSWEGAQGCVQTWKPRPCTKMRIALPKCAHYIEASPMHPYAQNVFPSRRASPQTLPVLTALYARSGMQL